MQHSKCCVVSQPPWVQIPALPPPPPGPDGAGRLCHARVVWRLCRARVVCVRGRLCHARRLFCLKYRSGSPAMSHVIPPRLLQTLNRGRWNCNVCGLSRKMTELNYVRLLEGWYRRRSWAPLPAAGTSTGRGSLYRPRAPLSAPPLHRLRPSASPGMRQRRNPEGSRLCCVCVVVVVAPPAPGPRASSWGNCSIRGATRRRHADRMLLMVQNPPPRRAERHAGLPRHEECSVLPPALDGVDGLRA